MKRLIVASGNFWLGLLSCLLAQEWPHIGRSGGYRRAAAQAGRRLIRTQPATVTSAPTPAVSCGPTCRRFHRNWR